MEQPHVLDVNICILNVCCLEFKVEWEFGKVVREFAFLDFKKNQKIFLQPVALHYFVAVLLTNAHTCMYGSQTSKYFGLDPPSVEEYFA